ncbi:MAG: thiamine pyrophosphate-requiring protein [Alphaproteobacteria bacterium]|nr:MAG: thiamine pyrophosphate-requiring protein [Alphaproteobacteria bacterium]
MQGSVERKPIAGEVFLRALAEHGVDFFFANPGTDFPPIVEAFSRGRHSNTKLPRPVLVPHENLAVAMAHGAYTQTGRPQAVMVHVNVGTGNTINNLINLARDRVPLILAAGRTPITEQGAFGSRSRQIHWGQEMFDQAGMVREIVKWDYELRVPGQVADVVARAHEVAMTVPRGPVYLVLPREPLSASLAETPAIAPRPLPGAAHPDPAAIEQLAEWIALAQRPLIITAGPGTDESAVVALAKVAGRAAIPVVSHNARSVALPSSDPMNAGYDSGPLVGEADLIIVIESDAPWYPNMHGPAAGCRVAHIGEDPIYARYPMRSFPSDLSIASPAAIALAALDAALAQLKLNVDVRRTNLVERHQLRRAKAAKEASASALNAATFSAAVGEAAGTEAIIFNEYPLSLEHCAREKAGTFYGLSAAGGLGWGLGAAMGAKLAAPEKFVVATVGDGAYMFANPTVCHWVADKFAIPVLTVLFNNARYGAVRRATLSMFKDGAAGEDDGQFLADLSPSPPFEEIVRLHGGHGERVETHAELAPALARARDAVRGGQQAVVNVLIPN